LLDRRGLSWARWDMDGNSKPPDDGSGVARRITARRLRECTDAGGAAPGQDLSDLAIEE